jgi:hypothetical protein
LLLLLATTACGGAAPRECTPLPLTPAAAEEYRELGANLPFDPILPCSHRSDVEVVRVLLNIVPAGDPQPRLSFVAQRRGERAFTFSITAADLPFTAIPQGTHRLRTTAAGVVASGFAGSSGGGDQIAYLRWQLLGLTYELDATLAPWLSETNLTAIARALIERQTNAAIPNSLNLAEDLRPGSRSRTTLPRQLRRPDHRHIPLPRRPAGERSEGSTS